MQKQDGSQLSAAAKIAAFDTFIHIRRVGEYLSSFAMRLMNRGMEHDESKLSPQEAELFAIVTPRLRGLTFGTPEYEESKKDLGKALVHHYAHNRHHPEHFPNGVNDMTLVDIVEMFCDWKASSERHADGNLLKSIRHNSSPEKFNICPQLQQILENTAKEFDRGPVCSDRTF